MSKRRYCEKCGNQLSEGMKFCDFCGTPVPEEPVETTLVMEEMEERRPRRPQAESRQEQRVRRPQPENRQEQRPRQPQPESRQEQRPRQPQPESRQEQRPRQPQPYPNGGQNYYQEDERRRRYRQEQMESSWQQSWEREPEEDDDHGFTPVQYVLIGLTVVLLIALIGFGVYWIVGRNTSRGNRSQNVGQTNSSQSSEQMTEAKKEGITILDDTADNEKKQPETKTPETQKKETEPEKQPEVQTEPPVKDAVLDYREFTITLPGSWKGKYGITQGPDYYIFYQRASKEAGYGGTLFSVSRYTDTSYRELPDFEVLGTGNGAAFVYQLPTDVQCATNDAAIAEEYQAMVQDLNTIKKNIRILVSGDGPKETEAQPVEIVDESAQDGYIPESSQRLITDADTAGMSYDDLQMAINEIYARHGRIFSTPEISAYFNRQPWYKGTVSAENFSDSVFSSIESQNIQTLLKKMGAQ